MTHNEKVTEIYRAAGIISCVLHVIPTEVSTSEADVPSALEAAHDILMRVAGEFGTEVGKP